MKRVRDYFIQAIANGSLNLMYYGPPPRTDAEARAISLAKYEMIAGALEQTPTLRVVAGGAATCGLCLRHLKNGCRSCPIYRKTGLIRCQGTPLVKLILATERGRGDPFQAACDVVAYLEALEVDD